MAQSPTAANPPTLFLALSEMTKSIGTNASLSENEDIEFLSAAWPRLHVWFQWYNQSQQGPVPGSYQWKGRDGTTEKELNPKTLTSGLDDYPRASHPSPDERHVDLRCWMALASRAMSKILRAARAPESLQTLYDTTARRLEDYEELKKLHWDDNHKVFADWGNNTPDVELVANSPAGPSRATKHIEWKRVVYGNPPKLQFVDHKGYVSLFPLALKLIPKDAPELASYLDIIKDPNELWSDFGLRSLSKSSSMYGVKNTWQDPPYWRGPIWINMNYLVLTALRDYSNMEGPYASRAGEIAKELGCNLIKTIQSQYYEKGFVFENYDDETGEGKGCHPFTGWTALLSVIASENYQQGCIM